ncbi:MAG: GTPase HflX [Actinobacteria bacterium ADurb.Bin346]|nr:MAG: GTPase HflX [Actinobacteria bacterium ADurb.Bin346]
MEKNSLIENYDLSKNKEKALLVFIKIKSLKKTDKHSHIVHASTDLNSAQLAEHSSEEIEELKNLTLSAGAEVSGILQHKQAEINPKFFISAGKVEEIKSITGAEDIDLVIFDNDLTPAQQSNLETAFKLKVIDRTALILDIFAQRAQSSEGKLQVELAQLNYILPRLRGKGIQLSRLGGGIGTRGPGEQKLEVDRRKIRKKINQLEIRINNIAIQRETQRKNREENSIFSISLVGYTNSGKSTLLNTLTKSDVLVKDMLFSTLDSTTRKLRIPEMDEILISDTVGFIEKLPHQLVAAFKSTLEEVRRADLLLLVVDSGNIYFEHQIRSVMKVLKEIEIMQKPIILVFNKIDKINSSTLSALKLKYRNSVFISALKKTGLENLYDKIKKNVDKNRLTLTLKIPYTESNLLSFVYNYCKILEKKYTNDSLVIKLNANKRFQKKLSPFIISDYIMI